MRNLASGRAGNNFFRAMDCEQVGDPCALSASSCRIGFRSEYLRNALAVTEEGEILSLETINPFIHTNIYSSVLTVKSCLLRHPLQRQRWIS
jgi:hypothetical protein